MDLPTTLAFDGKRIISLGWKNPNKKKYEDGIFPRFSLLKLEGIHQMTVNPNAIVNIMHSPDLPILHMKTETITVKVIESGQLGEPSYYPYLIVHKMHNIVNETTRETKTPN